MAVVEGGSGGRAAGRRVTETAAATWRRDERRACSAQRTWSRDREETSSIERLRRSTAQRFDAEAARLTPCRTGSRPAWSPPTGPVRASVRAAAACNVADSFSFLLAINISKYMDPQQTDGVMLNDGGNTDVHHSCDADTSEPQPGVQAATATRLARPDLGGM